MKRLRPPYPVAVALPVLLALLILGAVLPVIVATYVINRNNAGDLLGTRAELLVDGLENQLTGLLDPVASQFVVARNDVEARGLSRGETTELGHFMRGLLTGSPQLAGAGVIRPDGSMRRWESGRPDVIEEPATAIPLAEDALRKARQTREVLWATPFVSRILGDTILNPRIALQQDGEFAGVLVGAVAGARLSDYVAQLSGTDLTAFVLYDRTGLIAYPGRASENELPVGQLPTIADSSIPVLRDIWNDVNPLTQTSPMTNTQGHWSVIGGTPYAYFYREIIGYGPKNLLVGVAIPSSESWMYRWAAAIGAGIGGVVLLVALIIGYRVARRVAQPFEQFDTELGKFETMDFEGVTLSDMQRSPIAELATSANRLTRTAQALTLFNQYVPRTLSQRLMRSPKDAAETTERDITVMFIDLEGFSAFAANRSARETADWLNSLFAVIGPVIERNGGMIDKYTGDGLMAFWGAPDAQSDHTARAINAASDIARVLTKADVTKGTGSVPRLRIGIHTGPATVGNLGFKGRLNFTVIGRTVNIAERVEQSLRGVQPEEQVAVGLLQDVWARAGQFDGLVERAHLQSEIGTVVFLSVRKR